MTELEKTIKKIAIAYIFLHLNFSLGTLNILPDWVGYLLIFDALPPIAAEREDAKKLYPLAILLGIIALVQWFLKLVSIQINIPFFHLIPLAISLYFHFLLLTHLAGIAQKYECPEEKKLLVLRTVQTILTGLLGIPYLWNKNIPLGIFTLLIGILIVICIIMTLFSLQRSLMGDKPSNIIYCDTEDS